MLTIRGLQAASNGAKRPHQGCFDVLPRRILSLECRLSHRQDGLWAIDICKLRVNGLQGDMMRNRAGFPTLSLCIWLNNTSTRRSRRNPCSRVGTADGRAPCLCLRHQTRPRPLYACTSHTVAIAAPELDARQKCCVGVAQIGRAHV